MQASYHGERGGKRIPTPFDFCVLLFVGGWALEQLWLFWFAPVAEALLAGLLATWLHDDEAT